MNKESSSFKFSELSGFFKSKVFWYNVIRFLLVIIILWIINSLFLNIYTNHGQKLVLQKYEGLSLEQVRKHAEAKGYQLVVFDSVFIKGKPGGFILSQIPVPGSKVKRGRTIYITVSKYESESFASELLPVLYGKKLEFKKNELFNTFELISKIKGTQFDPGPENYIMEVYYKGNLIVSSDVRKTDIFISKGDTLEFILSTKTGGLVPIPNLVCQSFAAAKFLLSTYRLELSNLEESGEITDQESAYVLEQFPSFELNKKIEIGTTFHLKIIQLKPVDCDGN